MQPLHFSLPTPLDMVTVQVIESTLALQRGRDRMVRLRLHPPYSDQGIPVAQTGEIASLFLRPSPDQLADELAKLTLSEGQGAILLFDRMGDHHFIQIWSPDHHNDTPFVGLFLWLGERAENRLLLARLDNPDLSPPELEFYVQLVTSTYYDALRTSGGEEC